MTKKVSNIKGQTNNRRLQKDRAADETTKSLAEALVRDWQRSHMYRRLRFR